MQGIMSMMTDDLENTVKPAKVTKKPMSAMSDITPPPPPRLDDKGTGLGPLATKARRDRADYNRARYWTKKKELEETKATEMRWEGDVFEGGPLGHRVDDEMIVTGRRLKATAKKKAMNAMMLKPWNKDVAASKKNATAKKKVQACKRSDAWQCSWCGAFNRRRELNGCCFIIKPKEEPWSSDSD